MKRRSPTSYEIALRVKEMGLSRSQFSKRLGLSMNQTWKIENVGPSDKLEVDAVIKALWPDLTEEELTSPDRDHEEWRGLTRGDPCRVVAKNGNMTRFPYTFDLYHWSPFHQYVLATRTDTGNSKEFDPASLRGARGQELSNET